MLCVEDYLDTLELGEVGRRLEGLHRARRCQHQGHRRLGREDAWVDFLAKDPATRSNTSVCLKIVDPAITSLSADAQAAFAKELATRIEKEGVGLRHRRLSRRAGGPAHLVRRTVERADIAALTHWLDWAYAQAKAALPKAA